jgi:hypothetical protein
MGIRYEWLDDSKIIMLLYVEAPWTWTEYNQVIATVMPMLGKLNYPCATIVETSKFKILPKDGNALEILKNVEKTMPPNLFASAIVSAPYSIRVFMNILMKLRPRAERLALFTATIEEARTQIYARHREFYPDLAQNLPKAHLGK